MITIRIFILLNANVNISFPYIDRVEAQYKWLRQLIYKAEVSDKFIA